MLPSIDVPHGDQVERRPAATASATPTTTSVCAIATSLMPGSCPGGQLLVEQRIAEQRRDLAPRHRRALAPDLAGRSVHEAEVRRHLDPEVLPGTRGLHDLDVRRRELARLRRAHA